MASGGGDTDDLEIKIAGMNLADRKKLSGVMKSKFTRYRKSVALVLQLWAENLEDPVLAHRAKNQIVVLRSYCENTMRAYDVIQGPVGMSEEVFQRDFEPKIQEIEDEMAKLETGRN